VHEPGVGALLKRIGERGLSNVRICAHDAVEVTEIIEVRESVVFEEVSFDPEEPADGKPESGEEK